MDAAGRTFGLSARWAIGGGGTLVVGKEGGGGQECRQWDDGGACRGRALAMVVPAGADGVGAGASSRAEVLRRRAPVSVAGKWPAALEAVEEPGVLDVGLVRVLSVGEQFEVVELVVLFVAVEVVDVFVGEQRAVQLDRHEEPVEPVAARPANPHHDVALTVESASTVRPAVAAGGSRRPGA